MLHSPLQPKRSVPSPQSSHQIHSFGTACCRSGSDSSWDLDNSSDPSPSVHGNHTVPQSSPQSEMVPHPFQRRLLFPAGRSDQGKNALKTRHNVTRSKEADRTKGIKAHHKLWRDSYNISSAPAYHRSENLSQSRAKQCVLTGLCLSERHSRARQPRFL